MSFFLNFILNVIFYSFPGIRTYLLCRLKAPIYSFRVIAKLVIFIREASVRHKCHHLLLNREINGHMFMEQLWHSNQKNVGYFWYRTDNIRSGIE